jgi:hypothetical protein
MVELPSPTIASQENKGPDENYNSENREASSDSGAAAEPEPVDQKRGKMLGHPCAAGCGHYCWAVME